jgi:signal transduction histidine kinase
MSLNLEAAAHQTEGRARESVRTAQSLARTLLGDVREIAGTLKADAAVDLGAELARLAREVPSPRIHLSLPGELHLDPPALAGTLLRCAQEIVTNAIRHGAARNLWIELAAGPGGLSLSARDDGRGVRDVQAGVGLEGIRRRVEELGGSLAIESGPGAGFALVALLPAARSR